MIKSGVERLPGGIFEKVAGSRVFWIRYGDADGKLHREKAGSLTAAKNLPSVRPAEKLNGKLPNIAITAKFPAYDPALVAASISNYTWHGNRHSACSRPVLGGVPLAAVAKYVGHTNDHAICSSCTGCQYQGRGRILCQCNS